MGRLVSLDMKVIEGAASEAFVEIANEIAAEVEPHYPTVEVSSDADGVHVTTYGSFDHFKEWGSVNNTPSGYMRVAAQRHGRFHPEGK